MAGWSRLVIVLWIVMSATLACGDRPSYEIVSNSTFTPAPITPAPTNTALPLATRTVLPLPPTIIPISPSQGLVPVVDVVDGDTLKVRMNNSTETIRIIGIDTPEVVDPREPVQCFGREASAKANELLAGQQVRLVADPTQGERDNYSRLLRYIELSDGTDYGLWMIENGYAHEYTYDVPYQRQAAYKAAYARAREKGVGFWAPNTCKGNTKQPAPSRVAPATLTPTVSPPVATSSPITPVTLTPIATALATLPASTATPIPTVVPTAISASTYTVVPASSLPLDIVSVTSPVRRGARASLAAKTTPGANCTIVVHYKSGPSQAQVLDLKQPMRVVTFLGLG